MIGKSVDVVGVRVSLVDTEELIDELLSWNGPPRVAMGINAHVCNMVARSATFDALVRAVDVRYPDGQSIVWAARVLGANCDERVATTDFARPLAARCAAEGKRMFLFGGEPGVAAIAAERLRAHAPGLEVASSHGYISEDEMADLIATINEFKPHVLFVGLGDPLQQQWVATYRSELKVPAILTCGGLFDWLSGRNRRPPEWWVRHGLEWAWRVRLEPRRLAPRYFVGNPRFVAHLGSQWLRMRWVGRHRIAV
jgi:N-acetylglucosaminyldiphosphoundecaprenol N-acetyl-beta-D-mannosaminyltransferase